MSVPSTVKRKIVCIQDGQRYHIATLIIRPHKGEILYIPSQKGIKSPEEKEYRNLDHISFHTDGLVHLKYKFALLTYKTVRQYLPIEKMGYQEMINDSIKDIKSLPQTSESEQEIIFNIVEKNKPVHLNITLISGKVLIDSYESKDTKYEKHNSNFISSDHRAISNGVINTDKMLQIYAEYLDNMSVPRIIYIPKRSSINNSNQQENEN